MSGIECCIIIGVRNCFCSGNYSCVRVSGYITVATDSVADAYELSVMSNDSFEDTDLQICEKLYERLINTTEKVLEILKGNDLEIYQLLLLCFIFNMFNKPAGQKKFKVGKGS
ncbi:hypothetical protein RhiirB3_455901 [Rhizophagus irregularis]|nr:hypothetical protein RhiirB3_455901 [Rhizophagus irregularis]